MFPYNVLELHVCITPDCEEDVLEETEVAADTLPVAGGGHVFNPLPANGAVEQVIRGWGLTLTDLCRVEKKHVTQ